VKKWNPNCSFPTVNIGDKMIVGHGEDEIKEALGLWVTYKNHMRCKRRLKNRKKNKRGALS